MNTCYKILMALLLGAMLWPATASVQAQSGDTLVVQWHDGNGIPVINALRDAILNDTNRPEGRVYKLLRGGYYWNSDRIENSGFHLRIVGETPGNDIATAPAVIQMVENNEGEVDGRMITGLSDVTLKNLWITGATNTGEQTAYQPIQIDASNSTFLFENNIFERSNFALVAFTGSDNDITFRDNVFRNLIGSPSTQQWEGRGISIWADQVSVVVENNTFFNIGMTVLQVEGGAADFVLFNHNTMVNIGRNFTTGGWWQDFYSTNNLIINGFWHGEGESDLTDPNRPTPYPDNNNPVYSSGMTSIGPLPAVYGAEIGRRIVFANTATWRDPALDAAPSTIRTQPYTNYITKTDFFNVYSAMVARDTLWLANEPGLALYPSELIPNMVQNIEDLRSENTPAQPYFFRLPLFDGQPCHVCISWPLPENFSYTNTTLQTAGTDGLPLGDLNWFPEAKQNYLNNRDQYVADIIAMAGGQITITPLATIEAEDGELSGNATVESVEGETYFNMESGGFIEWTFDIATAGTYGLDVYTRSNDAVRGQRIILNGTNLRNDEGYGEYYFENLPSEGWAVYEVRQADLFEGGEALDLEPGTHTVRLEPSWGWQAFRQVDVVTNAGALVHELTAPMANSSIVTPVCADEDAYCASGFQYVAMGSGASISWNINVDSRDAGGYAFRLFYQAPGGPTTGDLLINGETVLSNFPIDGEVGDEGEWNVMTETFPLTAGSHTFTFVANGPLNADFVQLLQVTVSGEAGPMPDGYSLSQNYPNPFRGMTNIQYELGNATSVTIEVFDVLGRRVAVLADGEQPAGPHAVQFNAGHLASGMYFVRLNTPAGQLVRRMTVVN